ncbi:MAG: TIGR01777 family protein [Ignavibacteriaceae bacterium]|nr:TIGR01777 family protein [Ignavibacteriaceae bacterium]
MKRVLVSGASGLTGKSIVNELKANQFEVTVLGRNLVKLKKELPGLSGYIEWNYSEESIAGFSNKVEGFDSVIHLSGAGIIDKKWSDDYKKVIIESRTKTTSALIKALSNCEQKPESFICASAIGYYGDTGEFEKNESDTNGKGFLPEVCTAWENEAVKASEHGMREVRMRIGVVLTAEGGALKKMLLPFKLFIGGPIGSGEQWMSWIHINDLAAAFVFAIEHKEISGAINGTSPYPVKMKHFASVLGKTISRPHIFPVPSFVIKLILGESASTVLESQKVYPKVLKESGFNFKFPELPAALKNLLK